MRIKPVALMILALVCSMGSAIAQQATYATRPEAEKKGMAPGIKVTELTPATRRFEIVMSKGDEVIAGLGEFDEKKHEKVADFTAVGAFDQATLGWFDPEKKAYKTFPLKEEMEIASLTGNIRPDRNGKPVVHVHCVVATGDGVAHAGHLLDGHISLTLQLYMNIEDPLPASASK
jgi:predicted DNA-binding protein with PD1-like motif